MTPDWNDAFIIPADLRGRRLGADQDKAVQI
jgi:hypothetical protein